MRIAASLLPPFVLAMPFALTFISPEKASRMNATTVFIAVEIAQPPAVIAQIHNRSVGKDDAPVDVHLAAVGRYPDDRTGSVMIRIVQHESGRNRNCAQDYIAR